MIYFSSILSLGENMSYQKIDENLKKRKSDSLASLENGVSEKSILFILSSDDNGVVFNGGRKGARFGPKVIKKEILKLAKRNIDKPLHFIETCEKPLQISTSEKFNHFQSDQISTIKSLIKTQDNIIHLGGGHDHIYTFSCALIKSKKIDKEKFTIINIDAHLDSRSDDIKHSGTPFRQIQNNFKQASIIQLGIHDYANVDANYQDMSMSIHSCDEIKEKTSGFKYKKLKKFTEEMIEDIPKDHQIILSVDLDGFRSQDFRAVSAVNHDGLPLVMLELFIKAIKDERKDLLLGLYEYNPLFDTLASEDARKLASIMYKEVLKRN